MKKSNDKIPADEMLLARAIAEAKARGLKGCRISPFRFDGYTPDAKLVACCAIGGVALAASRGKTVSRERIDDAYSVSAPVLRAAGLSEVRVWTGNDSELWDDGPGNLPGTKGEDFGYAFRCAMEETP